jgi:hypothetical protein
MLFCFPAVGWGFFGWKIRPLASVEAAAAHAVLAVSMWGLNVVVFGAEPKWMGG